MMRPTSSLLAKILGWFFLNMVLVAVVLALFFTVQPQINLHALLGRQGADRLRTASQLIAHDLARADRSSWSDVLTRHAAIHNVDFTLVLDNGSHFSSSDGQLPLAITMKVDDVLRPAPQGNRFRPPGHPGRPPGLGERPPVGGPESRLTDQLTGKRPLPDEAWDQLRHLMLRTENPVRYWAGIRIPLPSKASLPPRPAILFAVSASITGKGFFFDPLPWIVVAVAVVLISLLFWIPMVRHITRPLARMTQATEKIALGRFDVAIHESRTDEIGRLANTINHMANRLSGFVNGQKRFLGDVSHELGSPIARIQFGLGALEQRSEGENRDRIRDVLEDVAHMSNLVNELLAYSRADLKSDTVKLEAINLLAVVQAAIKRETTRADHVQVQIDPLISVVASAELLTRAIANLVRNAVKYAGDAGTITITAARKNSHVEIEVRDSGPGVPGHLLDQLFEPFFRPEASRDRDSGGVGLGLAIVKTCVETCQGTVSAANLDPQGFAVKITLNN